jgi:hypothetical protein
LTRPWRTLAEAVELYLEEVDDPVGYISATPLVTSFRLPRRVSLALSDLPVRKVTWALESVGFTYVRTKGSRAVCRNRRDAWPSSFARRREARHVGVDPAAGGVNPAEFLKLLE